MNRRQLLLFVALMAGAPKILAEEGRREFPELAGSPDALWVPTVGSVATWLAAYREATVATAHRMNDLLAADLDTESVRQTREWVEKYGPEIEAAFADFQHTRHVIGAAMGRGYCAGYDGKERVCSEFTRPSNAGFGWYNGWDIGAADRVGRTL